MGSVKDLFVFKSPTETEFGEGTFEFSDRYSVFDYGEMPDLIPGKGQALAIMSAVSFERLSELTDIGSHYKGIINRDGDVVSVYDLKAPTNAILVDLVRVIKPTFENGDYDYSEYASMILQNCLIPLEVIYRNNLPQGSSVFKRLDSGLLTYQELGLSEYPVFGQKLPNSFFELTTKLEKTDRSISFNEAANMIGLFDSEMYEIRNVLKNVERVITTLAAEAGMDNDDGKIELAFAPNKSIIVVDVFGTPDECRFTYKGVQLSKEILRRYYSRTPWYDEVRRAKDRAKTEKVEDWQQFCSKPEPLPKDLLELVSILYMAMANAFVKKSLFNVPALPLVVDEYVKVWNKYQ
ncbi:MAG: phosphoribosylaminoimidazolesuccinocarboxamide synthase [Candidatus Moranbacteria bacterium]|nr:phosphoribosylaminoimidazolesuccinocarboxamide synthase [Candidatus Moranbacteria bacterium]